MFRHRTTVLVVASFVLSLVVGKAWGQTQYTVTDLGFGGQVNAINASGQVVGCCGNGTGTSYAVLYSNGTVTNLNTVAVSSGWQLQDAYGINNNGQIVGQGVNPSGQEDAFLYSNGTVTDLGAINGAAFGINASGQVTGASGTGNAFLYSNGTMTNIGTLPSPYNRASTAYGINDSGQVVGYCYGNGSSLNIYGGDTTHAYLYSNGTMTDLNTLVPAPYNDSSGALHINNSGQVVGSASDFSGNSHAFLYSNGTMTDLGTLGGTSSGAAGINLLGQVVGYAQDSSGDNQAFLYSNGAMSDLNTLVPGSGWEMESANAINDSGQIAGWGVNPSGQVDEFLLTPESVPEASTVTMLGTGLLTLGVIHCLLRRRKRT